MRVFKFAHKMKLHSKLIFAACLLLVTHEHFAKASPRNLRSRSSTPTSSQENSEEGAVSWDAPRSRNTERSNHEPKSYSRRVDGPSSRRKIDPPINMDIIPSNPDPALPRSAKNFRRGDSRRKPASETSFIQVTNNGGFSESRRARVLPSRSQVALASDELVKDVTPASRGHRQAARSRVSSPSSEKSIQAVPTRSRQRKTARELGESSRSARLLSSKPVTIDESKLEILSLDMNSGTISNEYDYNVAENHMKDAAINKVKTSTIESIPETTTIRSRGPNSIRSRGSVQSRQRQSKNEIPTAEATTAQSGRSRGRGRVLHTTNTEIQTEALFERTEKTVVNFTPRSKSLTPRSRGSRETSPSTPASPTTARSFRRPNLRKTSLNLSTETSSTENISTTNRRSDIFVSSSEKSDEEKVTTSSEPPLLISRRLRKKVLKQAISTDANQNQTVNPSSRGNFRPKVDKKKSGEEGETAEDYENENYPEHFKTLLLAKAKQGYTTQESLSTKPSRVVLNLYNPDSSQSSNVLKPPMSKSPRFRPLQTTPIPPSSTEIASSEDVSEKSRPNTFIKRKIKDTSLIKTTIAPPSAETPPVVPKYTRQHKFNASRYNGYKKPSTFSPVSVKTFSEKPKRNLPAFRSNVYSRSRTTTEKIVDELTIASLESENSAVEIPQSTVESILSTRGDSSKKFPARYTKFKPLPTFKPVASSSRTFTTKSFQRRGDRVNGNNLLEDSVRSSSLEESQILQQKSQGPDSGKAYNRYSSRYKAPLRKVPPVYQATVPTVTSTSVWLKFFVTDIPFADSLTEPVWFVAADGRLQGKSNHQLIRSADHRPRVN